MKQKDLKESFFEESAQVFKLLSSPIRLKLINYISYCPRSVENCAEKFGQSAQNISLHLQALKKVGILEVKKVKNYRIYSLAEKRVLQMLACDLIATPRSILPRDKMWDSDLQSLAMDVINERVRLIDLREPEEALFIPVAKAFELDPNETNLKSFLESIPPRQELVFFCRGNWCERMALTVKKASKFRPNIKGAGLNCLQLERLNSMIQNDGAKSV